MVTNEVLKNLLILAANANASEVVRGQALLKIDDLKQWLSSSVSNAVPKRKAAMLFALSQMDAFKADPNKFQTSPTADMPPGAPIGMPALDFNP